MIQKIKNLAHAYQADVAGLFYGHPSRKIKTIGVTGTDGKTTTSSLIFHILKTAGYKTAMITTVGAQIGDKEYDTGLHTTTPSAFAIQKYIKKAVQADCNYLVLETTSHALDQNRVRGVNFKIGVLTNITHEHLDYHKSYDNYVSAKAKLFKKTDFAVLNKDDESYKKILPKCKDQEVLTYSTNGSADFTPKNIGFRLPPGFEFNYENFLAAIAVAKTLGISDKTIELAISTFKFPAGRQEVVYDKKFRVIVDFAHTPNSFKKVLPSIKKMSKGRLIHVFGSAGQRDRSKRPLMGEISSNYADVIILTAEDSRNEPISEINGQIKLGVKGFEELSYKDYDKEKKTKIIFEIPDRKEAIEFALKIAEKDDVVITTGKGHEKSLNLGNGEVPWDEKDVILELLKK